MSDLKQIKIDNWGIFFLQRLQQFFNRTDFCDLTLQFENNVQLKVHRLVMNACTEYFQMLERECEMVDDCLIMPLSLQPDIVVPIVNFMYTGQLEFQMSNFDRLYAAAKLMNLTVLTKLLDAQKVPVSPLIRPINKRSPVAPVTWNLQGKKIVAKTMDPDLPEPLPGRKLPVWKRKTSPAYNSDCTVIRPLTNLMKESSTSRSAPRPIDNTPRPTRFEWPEDDEITDPISVSSFDDISYGSQPLATPVDTKINSSVAFEEIKKTAQALKRHSKYNEPDSVNLQDVKEYIQEHKRRNDFMQSERTSQDDASEELKDDLDVNFENDGKMDSHNKSILKQSSSDDDHPPSKKVRFSLEGKENATKMRQQKHIIETKVKLDRSDITNHTKIISEVLKKYPHLVQKNKNIKLKIMQKHNSTEKTPEQTSQPGVKPAKKANYVVKTEQNSKSVVQDTSAEEKVADSNTYPCKECNIPNEYIQLRSYPEYHDHLLEFHPEKIDTRVCEHCGHKSARRHLLVYHQFVKHNIEPPMPFIFPKCKQCDFSALNNTLLKKHETSVHITPLTESTIVCPQCNAQLESNLHYIKHCYQSGHYKENINFDCHYCNKKFLRANYVITHMRTYHKELLERDEVLNDVVVSKDPKDDIKIISNVAIKTKEIDEEDVQQDMTPTTPSSEAEALVNVASGIAASLGLVVLDDAVYGNASTEYIIPEINEEQLITTENQQTIALNVSEPNMISQTDIVTSSTVTSTDELVMVLTDHDYSDENSSIITSDNSNIVVLYSHPVEGQTTQYISSEGNIVLDSKTGLIEMNGHKIQVTNAEQLPVDENSTPKLIGQDEHREEDEEPSESIEMIQQEINNHLNIAQQKIANETTGEKENNEEEAAAGDDVHVVSEQGCEGIVENNSQVENDKEPARGDEGVIEGDEGVVEGDVNEMTSKKMETDEMQVNSDEVSGETTEETDKQQEKVTTDAPNEIVPDEKAQLDEVEPMEVDVDSSPKETESEVIPEKSENTEEKTVDNSSEVNETAVPGENNKVEAIVESEESVQDSEDNEKLTEKDEKQLEASNNEVVENEKLINGGNSEPQENTVSTGEKENSSENTEENSAEEISGENPEENNAERENTEGISEENNTESAEAISGETAEENIGENAEENSVSEENINSANEVDCKNNDAHDAEMSEESKSQESSTAEQSKDNVIALVSDWCDDDSGLQGADALGGAEKTNAAVEPTERRVSSSVEKVSTAEKTDSKAADVKITKLLDDWDDADTDSQNSGEIVQQDTNKIPINNLIEDWEDDE